MAETSGAAEPQRTALAPGDIVAANALLERLPYPILWIGDDYAVRWRNAAARATFSETEGRCHFLTQGFPSPCNEHGAPCPHRSAVTAGRTVSVGHVRRGATSYEFYKVTATPVLSGGILEFHVPLEDVLARDSMTGAYARPFFERLARLQLPLLERLKVPYCFVMFDVDHLKPINDQHGHPVGDAVLRAIGQAALGSIRAADALGRLGGDEFCLFLPNTDLTRAEPLVDRMRQALCKIAIPELAEGTALTASYGIHSSREVYDLDAAIALADQALYEAKADGRNRIVVLES